MFHPKVSIVIPVYNGANYVKEAIESALGQTYDNIEVIVVNDGSTDDGATRRIVESFGSRVVSIEKPNGGVATALNLGIEKMTGDFFSWLSHDDLYYPEKVATQVRYLETAPDRDVVLYSDYRLIDERSRVTTTVRLDHEMLSEKPLYAVLRGSVHGCSTLVPRSAFDRFGLFATELKTTQDYDLWFKMARQIRFVHIPRPLIGSRWHPEQGSKTNPATQREANELWIGFADRLTEAEMLRCEPTVYSFYHELAQFLAETPYDEARAVMAERAQEQKARLLADVDQTMVSVVMPVKDRIGLAVEAVRSACQQSHSNLEILVVDNASSESLEPLRELAQQDPRIRLLECPTGGASAARNRGIDAASGEYIALLDADDLWLREKISLQLEQMVLTGKPVSYTDYQSLTETGQTAHVRVLQQPSYRNLLRGCTIATPTVMLQASLLKEDPTLRFPETMAVGEDVCLWLDLARRVPFHHIPQPLTTVRVRQDSAGSDSRKQIMGLLNIVTHAAQADDFWETPAEIAGLLRFATWEMEKLAGQRLLDQAAQDGLVWRQAPVSNRLANGAYRLYGALPGGVRAPLTRWAGKILLFLERQAHREQPRRARIGRAVAKLRTRG